MYAGVDGCAKGWVAFTLPDETLVEGYRHFAELLADLRLRGVQTIGVDMPLHPPEHGERECDHAARDVLGAKRSSLFMTPCRAALRAANQAEATKVNRQHGGKGVSAQSFALRHKILEIAAIEAPEVVEVHPELSFHVLGRPTYSKRSWAGVRERVEILEDQGLHPMRWASTGWGAADDTLDAAVAALSARRVAAGEALRVPHGGAGPYIWA